MTDEKSSGTAAVEDLEPVGFHLEKAFVAGEFLAGFTEWGQDQLAARTFSNFCDQGVHAFSAGRGAGCDGFRRALAMGMGLEGDTLRAPIRLREWAWVWV